MQYADDHGDRWEVWSHGEARLPDGQYLKGTFSVWWRWESPNPEPGRIELDRRPDPMPDTWLTQLHRHPMFAWVTVQAECRAHSYPELQELLVAAISQAFPDFGHLSTRGPHTVQHHIALLAAKSMSRAQLYHWLTKLERFAREQLTRDGAKNHAGALLLSLREALRRKAIDDRTSHDDDEVRRGELGEQLQQDNPFALKLARDMLIQLAMEAFVGSPPDPGYGSKDAIAGETFGDYLYDQTVRAFDEVSRELGKKRHSLDDEQTASLLARFQQVAAQVNSVFVGVAAPYATGVPSPFVDGWLKLLPIRAESWLMDDARFMDVLPARTASFYDREMRGRRIVPIPVWTDAPPGAGRPPAIPLINVLGSVGVPDLIVQHAMYRLGTRAAWPQGYFGFLHGEQIRAQFGLPTRIYLPKLGRVLALTLVPLGMSVRPGLIWTPSSTPPYQEGVIVNPAEDDRDSLMSCLRRLAAPGDVAAALGDLDEYVTGMVRDIEGTASRPD